MANICTNTEVFAFMGTPADIISTQGTQITALITEQQAIFEQLTGRKVSSTAFSGIFFYQGFNADIVDDKLFLKGIYRDILTITELLEDGTEISVATGISSNGYAIDKSLGIIRRIGSKFLVNDLAYKITGTCGITTADVKSIIIEMTASKSGLWKSNVQTADGDISTIRTTISDDAKNRMLRYVLRDI